MVDVTCCGASTTEQEASAVEEVKREESTTSHPIPLSGPGPVRMTVRKRERGAALALDARNPPRAARPRLSDENDNERLLQEKMQRDAHSNPAVHQDYEKANSGPQVTISVREWYERFAVVAKCPFCDGTKKRATSQISCRRSAQGLATLVLPAVAIRLSTALTHNIDT